MSQSHRSQKVADRIKVVVAGLLEGKIKDPRLGFVTIFTQYLAMKHNVKLLLKHSIAPKALFAQPLAEI